MLTQSFYQSMNSCKDAVNLSTYFAKQIENEIHVNYYGKIVYATKERLSVGVKLSEFNGDKTLATCAAIERCAAQFGESA